MKWELFYIQFKILLHVAFVAEGVGVGLFGSSPFGREEGETVADSCRHRVGIEVAEIESMPGAKLGYGGACGAEYGLAPLHGLDYRSPEALVERWETETGTVGIEPVAFCIGDEASHDDVVVLGGVVAKHVGIFAFAATSDDEIHALDTLHHGQESMDVLFLFENADAEQEWTVVRNTFGPFLLGTYDGGGTAVNHVRLMSMKVDKARGILHSEAGNETDLCCTVYLALQAVDVLLSFASLLLVYEVDIVDGENATGAFVSRTEGRKLIDGMPHIEARHETRQESPDILLNQIIDMVSETSLPIFRHQ